MVVKCDASHSFAPPQKSGIIRCVTMRPTSEDEQGTVFAKLQLLAALSTECGDSFLRSGICCGRASRPVQHWQFQALQKDMIWQSSRVSTDVFADPEVDASGQLSCEILDVCRHVIKHRPFTAVCVRPLLAAVSCALSSCSTRCPSKQSDVTARIEMGHVPQLVIAVECIIQYHFII